MITNETREKHSAESNRILIVGGGRGGSAMLELMLDEEMVSVVGIVDVLPDAPGMDLARSRGIPAFTRLEQALAVCEPCMVFNLTGNVKVEEELHMLGHAGGIVGGVEALMMWRVVTRMKEMQRELFHQAQHDQLTGIYNRRSILEHLRRGVHETERYGIDYSAVMIDIDHFKHINDAYGHAAGDKALTGLVLRLQSCLRNTDIFGRWGGEEFMVLLPHIDGPRATVAARKWLRCVATEPMDLGKGKAQIVTFSAGVASMDKAWMKKGTDAAVDAFLECLDKRLYRAKESGRNRVMGLDGLLLKSGMAGFVLNGMGWQGLPKTDAR